MATEDIAAKVKELFGSLGIITGDTKTPDSIKLLQVASATTKKTGDPQIDSILGLVNNKALAALASSNEGPLRSPDGLDVIKSPLTQLSDTYDKANSINALSDSSKGGTMEEINNLGRASDAVFGTSFGSKVADTALDAGITAAADGALGDAVLAVFGI